MRIVTKLDRLLQIAIDVATTVATLSERAVLERLATQREVALQERLPRGNSIAAARSVLA